MKKASNNGKDLERAVHLIQESILRNDPKLKNAPYTVEINKRLCIDGTRYEVDVYVVTNPDTPYASAILFECKDLQKAVSTNQLMALNQKVELLRANRGVLVAPRISPDAAAQLPKFPRIEYRRCSEDMRGMLGIDFIHTVHEPIQIKVRLIARHAGQPLPPDMKYIPCRWGSRFSLFQTLIDERVKALAESDQVQQRNRYDSKSVHWHEVRLPFEFYPDEFMFGDVELAFMEIHVRFIVKADRHAPRYKCSVEGDGQVHMFKLDDEDFPKIEFEIICVSKKG